MRTIEANASRTTPSLLASGRASPFKGDPVPKSPAAPTPTRRLATMADAADYAGVHLATIRRRIACGDLTGYRFGPRMIRVDLDALDALMRPIPTAVGRREV